MSHGMQSKTRHKQGKPKPRKGQHRAKSPMLNDIQDGAYQATRAGAYQATRAGAYRVTQDGALKVGLTSPGRPRCPMRERSKHR